MAAKQVNPLLSTTKPPESPPSIKLHPLVLLTITDFITRHTLTERQGPIAGAVIGQQNGREITMEHAFESAVQSKTGDDGADRILLSEPWFGERLAQYREVHASPPLDLVAAFTLGSSKGPSPEHVPLVQQLKVQYNDDLMLILFHPETILDGSLAGGKLPITIYEAFYEPSTENGDKGLQLDGFGIGRQLQLRFRPLPFEVETGEAEMIAVDYVAKGAANANLAVESASKKRSAPAGAASAKSAGGNPADIAAARDEAQEDVLSPEDDELITSLTSKANAIKMLSSRIALIQSYLTSLPPSYLTDASIAPATPSASSSSTTATASPAAAGEINHTLLRQIAALQSRLPLLAPPTPSTPNNSSLDSDVDVALTSLLASLTRTVAAAGTMSSKASVVARSRVDRRMGAGPGLQREGPSGGGGGGDGPETGLGESRWRGGNNVYRGEGAGGGERFEESGFDSGADAGEDY